VNALGSLSVREPAMAVPAARRRVASLRDAPQRSTLESGADGALWVSSVARLSNHGRNRIIGRCLGPRDRKHGR
jgi:hypothetical protein